MSEKTKTRIGIPVVIAGLIGLMVILKHSIPVLMEMKDRAQESAISVADKEEVATLKQPDFSSPFITDYIEDHSTITGKSRIIVMGNKPSSCLKIFAQDQENKKKRLVESFSNSTKPTWKDQFIIKKTDNMSYWCEDAKGHKSTVVWIDR